MTNDLAHALYNAVTPQPRRTWNRLPARHRERFVLAAWAISRSQDRHSIGLLRLLQNQAADQRREQLWRMRNGKF